MMVFLFKFFLRGVLEFWKTESEEEHHNRYPAAFQHLVVSITRHSTTRIAGRIEQTHVHRFRLCLDSDSIIYMN